MNIDWLPWVIRAVLIITGIVMVVMIGNRKVAYSTGVSTIGITAFIMGVVLLIVSRVTDLSLDYDLFLTVTGVIVIIIGFVIRKTWDKKH